MRNYLSLRRPRRRQGLATVELAIVLPLLVLMLFGIMEMGLLFKDVLMLQQGVREAARSAALGAVPALEWYGVGRLADSRDGGHVE
jgi:Flp pilus assembly protein TadG